MIAADIDFVGAKQIVAEIEAQGGQALAVKVDITKEAEVNEMRLTEAFGYSRLDFLAIGLDCRAGGHSGRFCHLAGFDCPLTR